MEDILASIRRIIASDQSGNSARSFSPAPRVDVAASGDDTPHADVERSSQLMTQVEPPMLRDAGQAGRAGFVEHPGSFPGLHDLDTRIAPPASLDQGSGAPSLDSSGQAQDEALLAGLHDQLFASASHAVSEDYDLDANDLHTPESLISSSAGASISSSFHLLADTMLLRDPEMLERIARETLRPMLKSWLDENLPSMVERLVRSEIERVARGGRSRD